MSRPGAAAAAGDGMAGDGTAGAGEVALSCFQGVDRRSTGYQLLQQMGWREGQGLVRAGGGRAGGGGAGPGRAKVVLS